MVRKLVPGRTSRRIMDRPAEWRVTREHQGCPYPGAHQKEEKERNLFASLGQYSTPASPKLLDVFPM
jgi:hypothetical protein